MAFFLWQNFYLQTFWKMLQDVSQCLFLKGLGRLESAVCYSCGSWHEHTAQNNAARLSFRRKWFQLIIHRPCTLHPSAVSRVAIQGYYVNKIIDILNTYMHKYNDMGTESQNTRDPILLNACLTKPIQGYSALCRTLHLVSVFSVESGFGSLCAIAKETKMFSTLRIVIWKMRCLFVAELCFEKYS